MSVRELLNSLILIIGVSKEIPFNKSKHFNKLLNNGKIKSEVRILNRDVTFIFELEDPKIKESSEVLEVNVGVKERYLNMCHVILNVIQM